ncbi:putative esterase of the alpha-beta hydrolase superfamily [Desulfitobacterium dichloroeliminans LMG P-21439]|uniref:Putative esterase of the alpha-beta hydrolase superfamily n=1 Tax=Desulfitobacterium dichloroeliminans (strain LMG P-21439 / DCA1) TaxID=871963 RepID=L0F8I7_DESDL|nr:patatin-like phospholipase family protein [Desulfitobacterium dichloroeliminans]AGA70129.1 putative esterase of the alpha-beta hydrolase superfamily [Desulfitobacterium dichloroeliminans LMG P-21439]
MKKGLVLGSGGARGLAHLGFLQVLEEEKIEVDCIVGCSIGAVFGALWAAGVDLYRLERLITYQGFSKRLIDLSVSRDGFVKGEKFLEAMRLLTKDLTFAELRIPLAIVATDIETGNRVVFREGSVAHAVRASVSIPGVFKPYSYQGHLLVDGAVKNRLPIMVAKELGADRILAVDVKKGLSAKLNTAMDVMMQSLGILEEEVFQTQKDKADVLIQPEVGHIGILQFDQAEEAIALGRTAANSKLSDIVRIFG